MEIDKLADAIASRLRVPQQDRLIDIAGLCDLLGVSSKTTASRIAARADFPQRVMLARTMPRWVYGEVAEWVRKQR